jgi:hypothetical protein
MIRKQLVSITPGDLEALVINQVHEGRMLDYKQTLQITTGEEKRELARDLSSFANAAGGDLIYGVGEAKDSSGKNLGYPSKIVGFPCSNYDDVKLRIESIARDHVAPRIPGIALHKMDGFPDGSVVIIRIPQSWNAPHMAATPGQTHFYSRNSAGKQPLDVHQIRAAFVASADTESAVRRFRDERLSRLVAGELPIELKYPEQARLLAHVVPLVRDGTSQLDLHALKRSTALVPFERGSGWNHRYNLDGLMAYTGSSYTLAFRTGAIEGSTNVPVQKQDKEPLARLYAKWVETQMLEFVQASLTILRDAAIESPVVVLLALSGLRGVRFENSPHSWGWGSEETVDRDIVVLPELLLEDVPSDMTQALRPIFDALWQCSGWDQSPSFDQNGTWRT